MHSSLTENAYIRGFLLAVLVLTLIGCKLRIKVPEGGRVASDSGTYSCESGQKCTIDVVDIFFDEDFLAQPAPGYYFRRWKGGERFFCADTYGSCRLSTVFFAGKPVLEQLLESDEIFFLMPLFAEGTCEQVRSETSDIFENILTEEGQKCTVPDQSEPAYQGPVESRKNGSLVSVISWDQGRMQGEARRYHKDGITLQEASAYVNGKYDGPMRTYDEQGRRTLVALWQAGILQGKQIAYDYTKSYLWEGEPIVRTSYYKDGLLDGESTSDYPDGVWEIRNWVEGVQEGDYEVFAPSYPNSVEGWRYVYVFVQGLVRYGYAYARVLVPGSTDEYVEEGGPDGPWIWSCEYIDGVLDEEDCFRDGLDLGPRV